MALKPAEWIALFCVCVFGIQSSYSFMAEMNDIMNNCRRDGGFCINTIPPPPPPTKRPRGRGRGRGRARAGPTQTRRGSRPTARQMGAGHQRLPGSASAPAAGGAPYPPPAAPAGGAPAYQPQAAPQQPAGNPFGMGFGSSPNDPFRSLMPFMFFTRKKRQAAAAAEPVEGEIPRIRRGQQLLPFLNAHCRKSEFDFGCRSSGGFCCLPPL